MKRFFAALIVLLCMAIVGYSVFDTAFPKADPVSCPAEESIRTISLAQSNGAPVHIEVTESRVLSDSICNARPTRQMTVNDYPAVKAYYILDIDTAERRYRYYIYEENSVVYIEMPYEGIYKADQKFLDLVTAYFE